MNFPSKPQRILGYESIAFVFVIALSWLDEFLNLPGLLAGGTKAPDWRESLIETVVAPAETANRPQPPEPAQSAADRRGDLA